EHGVPDINCIDGDRLRKRGRYVQKVRSCLRDRFRLEYLGQLKEYRLDKKSHYDLKIGELVFVGDDFSKRLDWPLGRVQQLIQGKDGSNRVAQVVTQKCMILRPVQRLYSLEIQSEKLANEQPLDKPITEQVH